MARSSSTTRRCGASSASGAGRAVMVPLRRSPARPPRPLGAVDQPQHPVAVLAVDHGGEKLARRLMGARPDLAERAGDAGGLQVGKLQGQVCALRGGIEQPLAAVALALALL